ncbi:MAG: DNA gyrase subunit A, partial [Opitutae bacterium]
MSKKKSSKNNDQPELPLGGETPPPETGDRRPEPGKTGKTSASTRPDSSTNRPEPVEGAASSLPSPASAEVPPAPKRKKGEKVQDEQAPLALAYRNWFLDYASYVILDRAVPHIDDGLKPVQRRVLHTLWDMDDGRFHKVANVVGA